MDFSLILEMALIAVLIGIFKASAGSYSHETMIIKDLRSKKCTDFFYICSVHHTLWLVTFLIICYFERNHFQWWCRPSSMLWRGARAFFSELWKNVNTVERSRKTVNIVSCLKNYNWLFYRCSTTEPFSFWDMKYWFCCILNQTLVVLSNLLYIRHKKNWIKNYELSENNDMGHTFTSVSRWPRSTEGPGRLRKAPSCLDRGRGGASGPAKFKCHAEESEFPDIQLPRNRISRNNQDLESWVTMIATMKINLQNVGMKATQTGWQRCKYISPSQR